MKVVLDTNVYISAIIIGGICEKVLEEIRKRGIEILIPLDLEKGTGYAGERTRSKINQLLGF